MNRCLDCSIALDDDMGDRCGICDSRKDSPASDCSASKSKLKARMEGACAALEGRKLDANNYPEDAEQHWQWLDGWASTRLEMSTKKNASNSDTRSVDLQ